MNNILIILERGVDKMTSNNSPLEDTLWDQWLNNQEDEAANELIKHYMYLVNFHVDRVASHVPSTVSREDLKSFGLLGLYDALKKFEIKRNLKFDTYASFRIRGAIIDGLRKEDWLSRATRDKAKQVAEMSQHLEQKLHRTPTAEEIANKIGMSVEEVETSIRDTIFSNVLSIDEKPKANGVDYQEGLGYSIPDETSVNPDDHVSNHELNLELAHSLKTLNDNEQLVISLFYFEELTLTEIGRVMELTTSRISQIHKAAIFKLRKTLKKIM